MKPLILGIDQGTTGTRAILFDKSGRVVGHGYREIKQYFPKPGWVEHDPEEIWGSVLRVVAEALRKASASGNSIAAIGITNQRETAILWDRKTGRPLHKAIVWQDRRTADLCLRLKPHEPFVRRVTGLVLDPYFSGTKISWLLKHSPSIASAAKKGRVAFGTVDCWLLWRLSGGRVHATDVTNASRTLLYDLAAQRWSGPMIKMLNIPSSVLPDIYPSNHRFAATAAVGPLPSGIPVQGIAGDQQAALFGQGCVEPGSAKNTYGTGCFLLVQTGSKLIHSKHGLITTAACDERGMPSYALEGSVFIAGAVIQWLRDGLGIIRSASETEALARSVSDSAGIYFVPAFVGLGAPYWKPDARGLVCGLTRGTGRAHIVRAALESIAYQSQEVLDAMQKDSGITMTSLRVDGGVVRNNLLMQFQSDLSGVPVIRPKMIETTALGAAQLAGLGIGFWSQKDLRKMRGIDRAFQPSWDRRRRAVALSGWMEAVKRTL